jgi:hypothetical protein
VHTAADDAVGIVIFEVVAVSVVLCHFRLRTSWKPSSCVFFSVALPAELLAFKMDFISFKVTVYVPYSALNNVLPERALQKLVLFSSAALTIAVHFTLPRPQQVFIQPRPRCHIGI